jgi:hypothetical protein
MTGESAPITVLISDIRNFTQISQRLGAKAVVEMLNATLHKETFGFNCSTTGCRSEEIGPVSFPSIGVEAGF